MEVVMGVVFMPTMVVMVSVHHRHYICRQPSEAYAYRHHIHLLQQQEEMDCRIRRERNLTGMRMMKFTWTFPGSNNILKLNTDGSSKGNPGPSSFGGLIRDNKGRWLCGYMGKMNGRKCTSLEAEAWSVYKGLCLIKEMKLSCNCILIETDCQAILMHGVRKVNGKDEEDKYGLESVFRGIKNIMMELRYCTLIHTRRDGNHSADQLTKLGGRQTEDYVALEEPPTVLIPYLLCDIEAAMEFESNHCRS